MHVQIIFHAFSALSVVCVRRGQHGFPFEYILLCKSLYTGISSALSQPCQARPKDAPEPCLHFVKYQPRSLPITSNSFKKLVLTSIILSSQVTMSPRLPHASHGQRCFALMMSAEVIHLVSRELAVADSFGQGKAARIHGISQDIVVAIMGLIQENAAEGTGPTERTLRRAIASPIDRLVRVMSLHLISVMVTQRRGIDGNHLKQRPAESNRESEDYSRTGNKRQLLPATLDVE